MKWPLSGPLRLASSSLEKECIMPRTTLRIAVSLASALLLVWFAAAVSGQAGGQPSTARGEWPHYTAEVKGTRYSPLDHITTPTSTPQRRRGAIQDRQPRPLPRIQARGHPADGEGRPLHDGGTRRSVIALDARTGELIWAHSMREGKRAACRRGSSRAAACRTGPTARATTGSLRDDRLSARRAQREDRAR